MEKTPIIKQPNQKINYDQLMQEELDRVVQSGKKPTLLLHSCCAPCSSYVLKRLQKFFEITVFFYNVNLYPTEEYNLRLAEQKRLIRILNKVQQKSEKEGSFEHPIFHETPIKIKTGKYNPKEFYEFVEGFEKELEGAKRCYLCYTLRLNKTAKVASKLGFDYYCTTLTVSPYKNAQWVNEVGQLLSEKYNIPFLFSDFKKNDGYKKSIEYSEQYHLYRQNYCGCEFSLQNKIACLK